MRHAAFDLSAENYRMLYVPEGFGHSFQTLVEDCEVTYLVTASYAPEAERGLRFSDPRLRFEWPLPVSEISAKDASWPLLGEQGPQFFD
jgi:dTDP-4-dehydrorhamnose 3,5-epimerase